MEFSRIEPYFKSYGVWSNDRDIEWYEVMWEVLLKAGAVKSHREEEVLESYLYATALVDFYRSFTQDVAGEYWHEDFLSSEKIPNYHYEKMRKIAGAMPITLQDLFDEYGEQIFEYSQAELAGIFAEFAPEFSSLYYDYAAKKYKRSVLALLKQKFSESEMFILMTYSYYGTYSDMNGYFDDEDDYEEDEWVDDENDLRECQGVMPKIQEMLILPPVLTKTERFIEDANSASEYFYDDMDLIRGVEWLSVHY